MRIEKVGYQTRFCSVRWDAPSITQCSSIYPTGLLATQCPYALLHTFCKVQGKAYANENSHIPSYKPIAVGQGEHSLTLPLPSVPLPHEYVAAGSRTQHNTESDTPGGTRRCMGRKEGGNRRQHVEGFGGKGANMEGRGHEGKEGT